MKIINKCHNMFLYPLCSMSIMVFDHHIINHFGIRVASGHSNKNKYHEWINEWDVSTILMKHFKIL